MNQTAVCLDEMSPSLFITKEFVTIGGDLSVGSLLSQIVYWHRPGKNGKSKLRVKRDGVYWIAKTREEWCEETCLTLRQYRRCISVLIERGLIEMQVKRFKGVAICHVRLLIDSLEKSLNELRQEGQKVTPTKAQTSLLGGQKGKSI